MKKPEPSVKLKKSRRNLTAIAVGFISFCILFAGISFTYGDTEISVSDLPDVSVTEQVTEAVTTATSEVSEIVPEETTIATTEAVTNEATTIEEITTEEAEVAEMFSEETTNSEIVYILNTNTKKFHYPDCRHVSSIKDENKVEYSGTRDELIEEGYSPCGTCLP